MIRFKKYLLEYLTDDQRARYAHVKMGDKARSDTDHFFGKDNDIVRGALHHLTDKSEIHKKVENHLGRELSHDEYTTGLTKDKYGRDAKIGRMIKDEKLRDEFARDPVREGSRSRQAQYTTSTVRGVEVAGQTNPTPNAQHPKGHSWHGISCKNVETGINKHYLEDEIQAGTVVHRVHDHNGQEIYRATLQPHHNENGDVAYAVDSEYGIKHPSFTNSAHETARQLSGKETHGFFTKHSLVYSDNGMQTILHPAATQKQIGDALVSTNTEHQAAAIQHPNVQEHHLTHALKDSLVDPFTQTLALRHPLATAKHVELGLKSPHPLTRWVAIEHPSVTPKQISRALDDESINVRAIAIQHPNASHENLVKALHPSQHYSIRLHALTNPNISAKHIDVAMKDSDPEVRGRAVSHPKATETHINKGLNDSSMHVRLKTIGNPNLDSDQLNKALNDKESEVRVKALSHPNITSDHLHTALKDSNPMVRKKAVDHPKATPEHWKKMQGDENYAVRMTAWDNLDRHYHSDSA